MSRALWTGLAIVGAVLVQTALGYLFPGPGRFLDPFLLVVVYCALAGGFIRSYHRQRTAW